MTGGAGFIGSNFVRRIIEGSLGGVSSVTVMDKLTYAGTLTNLASLTRGDTEIGIVWPFENLSLSSKDANAPTLHQQLIAGKLEMMP